MNLYKDEKAKKIPFDMQRLEKIYIIKSQYKLYLLFNFKLWV